MKPVRHWWFSTLTYPKKESHFCIFEDKSFMKARRAPCSSFFTIFFNLFRMESSWDPYEVTALWPRSESRVERSADPEDSRTCLLLTGFDGSPSSDKQLLRLLLCVEPEYPLVDCEFLSRVLCVENRRDEFVSEIPLEFWKCFKLLEVGFLLSLGSG